MHILCLVLHLFTWTKFYVWAWWYCQIHQFSRFILFTLLCFYLSQCTLITIVCTPNASSNINFTVIILSGNNLTASISWNSNSDVQVSRYIVYVSHSDDPTTYNGTHLYDEEKYKIVSILLTHYHHYLIVYIKDINIFICTYNNYFVHS